MHKCDNILNGFSILELMIVVGVFGLIVAGTLNVYIRCEKDWYSTSLQIQTIETNSLAIAKMIYGIGTNSGLRSAATIDKIDAYGYWTGSNYPPPANSSNTVYGLMTNTSPNGSWRIAFSNSFNGVKWIDYNTAASNIVFWTAFSNPTNRELIRNYVSSAMASNTSTGLFISITVNHTFGQFNCSNEVNTFVTRRNN